MSNNKDKHTNADFKDKKVVEPLDNQEDDVCECESCSNEASQGEIDEISLQNELNQMLEQEKQNNANLNRMLQQLQADFDNYRKRNAKLAEEAKQKGIFEAVQNMLPAFDAIIVAKKQITDESTLTGLEMVERSLYSSLASMGISPIKTVGEQFDPNLHNAVVAEEVEGKTKGEILEEYSTGFNSPYGVVRFATVKVAK